MSSSPAVINMLNQYASVGKWIAILLIGLILFGVLFGALLRCFDPNGFRGLSKTTKKNTSFTDSKK